MLTNHRFTYLLLLALPFSAFSETSFEPNNTFDTARAITVSAPAQAHKFDYAGDEDWLVFYASEGTSYDIEIGFDSVGEGVNPALSLYNEDQEIEVALFDINFAGDGELLSWNAPATGFFYIQVSNLEPDFSTDGHYNIKVFVPTAPLDGWIEGRTMNACTKKNLSLVHINASKEGSNRVVKETLSLQGVYSLPLLSGSYNVSANLTKYQRKTLTVNITESHGSVLPIELMPEAGCTPPKTELACLPENHVGVYDDVSRILDIKDVRIGDEIISARLQAQADFSFRIISVEPVKQAIFDSPAFYNHDTFLADIPQVCAFKKVFKVQLEQKNADGIYTILSADLL